MADVAERATDGSGGTERLWPGPIWLRWIGAAAIVLLAAAPFLLVTIPPLVDAPGHLGQFAIQAAPETSPLRAYFGFHWAVRLNLGTDLLVEWLRHPLGLRRAFWVTTAIIPLLTAAGILLLARAANPTGSAGSGWALLFVYALPFSYGFLNFSLALALSLIAFSGWIMLAPRPALREILFWPLIPALMICHAIGGGLVAVMIVARTLALSPPLRRSGAGVRLDRAASRDVLVQLRPLAGTVATIAIWRLTAPSETLPTHFRVMSKLRAVGTALRDQDRALDIASIAAVILVLIVGRWLGARYSRANAWVVGALFGLFLVMPSQLNGASFADVRLLPVAAIAALVLQDWSGVGRARSRLVAAAGLALFLIRLGVTAGGMAAYEHAYASEGQALAHIAPGSKVLSLVTRQCSGFRFWRMARLDHFAALATVERQAWVNIHWDLGAIHLLEIRFRPSDAFYDDPSQFVWPAKCLRPDRPPPTTPEQWRNRRRTIEQVLPELPLANVDYLWLVATRLPPRAAPAMLVPVWSNGGSTLYRVRRPPNP